MTTEVGNHLRLKELVDLDLFADVDNGVPPLIQAIEGFGAYDIVLVTDQHIASNAS